MEQSFRSRSLPFHEHSRRGGRSITRVTEAEPIDLNSKELEFFKELRNILSIPQFKRTNSQLECISKFLSQVNFFQEIIKTESEEAVYECAKYLKHYYSVLRAIPLHKENEANKFYLILSGSVRIYQKDEETGEEKSVLLQKFDTFGESYYKYESTKYSQAVCLGPVHFAILDSIDFKRIRDHLLDRKFKIVLKFLGTIPILSTLSRKYIEKILGLFKIKIYKRKEFVFKEKEKCEFVYFIEDGEFIISKNSRISSDSPARLCNIPKIKEYKAIQKLAIISKGELIGDEDILANINFRTYSCECHSETGKVLYMSSEDFFTYLAKTEEVTDILKERIRARESCRNNISRVSSEILKLRLPSPTIPRSPIVSPRVVLKEILTRSGHSTPIRNKYRIYYK